MPAARVCTFAGSSRPRRAAAARCAARAVARRHRRRSWRSSPSEPLAGFSDGNAFLRSPDNGFIFFPNGRLQVDTYLFLTQGKKSAKIPNDTFLLRRARLELGGWVGGFVYFWLAGDFALGPPAAAAPVAPSNIGTTDDFVALAPWNNLVILQVGQFDAAFTLENRTSDKYFDFMERSITGARLRHPRQQRDGGDAARVQRRPELLLLDGRR